MRASKALKFDAGRLTFFWGGMSEKHEKGEPRRIHIQKSKPVEIIFNGLWVRMVYFYFFIWMNYKPHLHIYTDNRPVLEKI